MLRVPVEFPWGLAPGERGGAPRAFHVSSRDAGVKSGRGLGVWVAYSVSAHSYIFHRSPRPPPQRGLGPHSRGNIAVGDIPLRVRRLGLPPFPSHRPYFSTSDVLHSSGPEGRGELAAAHRSAVLRSVSISKCVPNNGCLSLAQGNLM